MWLHVCWIGPSCCFVLSLNHFIIPTTSLSFDLIFSWWTLFNQFKGTCDGAKCDLKDKAVKMAILKFSVSAVVKEAHILWVHIFAMLITPDYNQKWVNGMNIFQFIYCHHVHGALTSMITSSTSFRAYFIILLKLVPTIFLCHSNSSKQAWPCTH